MFPFYVIFEIMSLSDLSVTDLRRIYFALTGKRYSHKNKEFLVTVIKNRNVCLSLAALKKKELSKLSGDVLKNLGRGKVVGMSGIPKKELVDKLLPVVEWNEIPEDKRSKLVKRAGELGVSNPQCYNLGMLKYYIHEKEANSDIKIHMGMTDLDRIYKEPKSLVSIYFLSENVRLLKESKKNFLRSLDCHLTPEPDTFYMLKCLYDLELNYEDYVKQCEARKFWLQT